MLRDWLADEWFLTANRIKGPEDTDTEVNLLVGEGKGILLFPSGYSSEPVEPESHTIHCAASFTSVNRKFISALSVHLKSELWTQKTLLISAFPTKWHFSVLPQNKICKYTEQFDFHTARIFPFSCLFMHFFFPLKFSEGMDKVSAFTNSNSACRISIQIPMFIAKNKRAHISRTMSASFILGKLGRYRITKLSTDSTDRKVSLCL